MLPEPEKRNASAHKEVMRCPNCKRKYIVIVTLIKQYIKSSISEQTLKVKEYSCVCQTCNTVFYLETKENDMTDEYTDNCIHKCSEIKKYYFLTK